MMQDAAQNDLRSRLARAVNVASFSFAFSSSFSEYGALAQIWMAEGGRLSTKVKRARADRSGVFAVLARCQATGARWFAPGQRTASVPTQPHQGCLVAMQMARTSHADDRWA